MNPGPFTKTLEKVLEHNGGSRKAFFQAYSGAHLIAMGNNILNGNIIKYLPPEIKDDSRIIVFFEAKKSMKKHLDMSDDEITLMKEKILAYGTYMKENLESLKTKQKGHLFLFDAPEFTAKFKTSSFFSDEPIEAYHPICNNSG
uniref:Uncharacterized protein n=1 Tax=Panagrolaimus superbus TaxID=310955 RepID=A0A914YKK3_9BILA